MPKPAAGGGTEGLQGAHLAILLAILLEDELALLLRVEVAN